MESKKSSSSRRISETPQSETRPHSSPDPFLRAGNQPKFWQTLSPKNSFAKTSSALNPHALPEYLEGRTPKEKHPFLFLKKFPPRQIRNARSVFLSGLPRLCEPVAQRYERTRQFRATTRSARGTLLILKIGSRLVHETPQRARVQFD